MNTQREKIRLETLGPAEQILETLLRHSDHMVHNRPGVLRPSQKSVTGVEWQPVTWRLGRDGQTKLVQALVKSGKKTRRQELGVMSEDLIVRKDQTVVGRFMNPGLVPEVAAWLYSQVAEVFKLDNEFVARWASWAFTQENRDLKVVLAAFMLVQNRAGEPITQDGEVVFYDDDYRDVGEAMCLLRRRDKRDLHPKLLLRVGELLNLSEVAAINRELGFGRSTRHPALGRWPKAVTRWLRFREGNPRMLKGLVKAGYRRTVMRLAQRVGYKPTSARFFEVLRWRQKQSSDGRRSMAIGQSVAAPESWEALGEVEICEKICAERPGFKRMVGLLPESIGMTRAIAAAAVESGAMSDADLIIFTPTLEALGLLDVKAIGDRWTAATERAENQRAANIAKRVSSLEVAQRLREGADKAVKKAVAEVSKGLRIYVFVDKSGSMSGAIDRAKECLKGSLQGFPMERTHVAVFNTAGREVTIQHASSAGVEQAFRGHSAGGGTDYGAGVRALRHHRPAADEDALFIFVGDQQAGAFKKSVELSGLNPVAFGMLHVESESWGGSGRCVEVTASELGIPCFKVDESTFADPYAVTRTLTHLIASTPVKRGRSERTTLVETILKTELLFKPVWA